MERYAVIVAGGNGSRMQTQTPKQFLLLGGKPVLLHTLARFHACDPHIRIILVLPEHQIGTWQRLAESFQCAIPHEVAKGGNTRFQSVRNGLAKVPEGGLVAIHDGVRPFVPVSCIEASYTEAARHGNAVLAVAPKDSLRQLGDSGSSKAVDRSLFRAIQTPQTFQSTRIKQAFRLGEQPFFTDDASVLEHAGHRIHLIEGDYRNIKITTPEDLLLGEALL